MSDVRIRDFAERAEQVVELPDLAELADRGSRLRRRRRVAVAGLAAAAVVAVAGGYLAAVDSRTDLDPVEKPPSERVLPYPGGSEILPLAAGTYEIELYREGFPATARFTVSEGWRGWFGPNMPYLERGYVGLLVADVDEVAERVCVEPVSDMRSVGDSPQRLVDALITLPRHPVVDGPAETTFAGWPATHLALRAGREARCQDSALEMWDSPGSGGLIQSHGGARMELWVVDVGGEAVLVSATIGRNTPDWAVAELEAVVDSVELVEGQD